MSEVGGMNCELNADFDTSLMEGADIQALVAAWQMGANQPARCCTPSRQGELPRLGRTNEQR